MNIRPQLVVLSCALMSFCPPASADEPPSGEKQAEAKAVAPEPSAKSAKPLPPGIARPVDAKEKWGKQVDPDKDSEFHYEGEELSILVKGGNKAHDLSAEIDSMSAPRVLQEVSGDFTIEVKASDVAETGENAVGTNRTGWNGAGILLMSDEKNYVRLELGGIKRPGSKPYTYINYQLRDDGKIVEWADDDDIPFKARAAAFLRIQRKGNALSAAVSHDGKTYVPFVERKLPDSWPAKITAGVAAGNNTDIDFEPTFSDLKLTSGAGKEAVKKP